PATLGGLEGDHPEALTAGRDNDDRVPLVHLLNGRDATEEADARRRRRAQLGLERACSRELERQLGDLRAGDCERAQEHIEALDGYQATNAAEARRRGRRRRLRPG